VAPRVIASLARVSATGVLQFVVAHVIGSRWCA